MSRPIVTTDVPGCRDIVRDGENGFLCRPRDTESLVQALNRAASLDDDTWRAMGRAGRTRASSEFSLRKVNSLYLQALADAGIRAPSGDLPLGKTPDRGGELI